MVPEMNAWSLGAGDPLVLTLAADFRLCNPDYVNDHIWEIEPGSGDPPAFAVGTTYGMRALTMRIFPRFTLNGQVASDPASFSSFPRLCRFFPNFLSFTFSPFQGIEIGADYWVPDSHSIAGQFAITNRTNETAGLLLELCAQLLPMSGQKLAPLSLHSTNILAGQCKDLAPVIFLTAGPDPGPGPFASLVLSIDLPPGVTRTPTWVQAALPSLEESFEHARHTAARPWAAELAKMERINASQVIEICTGDSDWDAAFALSQKTALGLFFNGNRHLPCPTFVNTRLPDQGYSPRGDGSDHPSAWSGQAPLEALTMASLLPGAPELAEGLVRNFLATQSAEGAINSRPGMAGQRGRWQAAPLLSSLAWQTFQHTGNSEFLHTVQAGLEAFFHSWFIPAHDRDGDGFPEWDHPLQTGLEDNPAFTVWHEEGLGADISTSETPALTAMLCNEARALADIAGTLGQPENQAGWLAEADRLRNLTEDCWNSRHALYHLRDRDTHSSPAGRSLATRRGPGSLLPKRSFTRPVRLLIRIDFKEDTSRRPEITLNGQNGYVIQKETLERQDFQWGADLAVATSRMVYTGLANITISGLEKHDRVQVSVMDFSAEDISLFLPLWAGIPNFDRVHALVHRSLLAEDRFGSHFGIPLCTPVPASKKGSTDGNSSSAADSSLTQTPALSQAIHLPWNILIGKGLLEYDLQAEAADLTRQLMTAVVQNLKQRHSFARAYHASNGSGIGERNSIHGLTPLGLFLETLGVRIESKPITPDASRGMRVILRGKNPFPWSITVKYRGLIITRHKDQTLVVFPSGQSVTLDDPTDTVISAE
jgi:hypothetical protein